LESPVGKGGLTLAGRYSYIGPVLRAVAPKSESFNLTVAPQYWDILSIYDLPINPKIDFKVTALGSSDTLEFLLKEPVNQDPILRGDFLSRTAFFRLIPAITIRHSPKTISRFSLGLGSDWIRTQIGDNFFILRANSLSVRGEIERELFDFWRGYLGVDNRYSNAKVGLKIPSFFSEGGVSNPLSTGSEDRVEVEGKFNLVGTYLRNVFTLGDFTLTPSMRVDYFQPTHEALPAPRTSVRYQWNSDLRLQAAGGLYYQPPREQELDSQIGNPDLESPFTWHATAGFEQDFRGGSSDGWTLSLNGFYRDFSNLVVRSTALIPRGGRSVSERWNNSGKGKSYGAEVFARWSLKPWTGWISYTLSRSTRAQDRTTQGSSAESLFQYDQTHNLNLIGSVELAGNWTLSSRFRFVTGNPNTPIVGALYDSDNGVFVPIRGNLYSERLEPFMQLDFRIDKKWIFDTWILSAYLDIQNVTNQKNMESVRNAYDYSKTENITGLPLIPTFGLKGEF